MSLLLSGPMMKLPAAGAFSPTDLFQSGEKGFWFAPTPSNTGVSVGTDVTTLTPDFEDATRLFTPESGSATEPVLRLDGTAHYLEFTAANIDCLHCAPYQWGDATNGFSCFSTIRSSSFATGVMFGSDTSGSGRALQYRTTTAGAAECIFWDGGGSARTVPSGAVMSTGTWYNICAVVEPAEGRIWVGDMEDANVDGTYTNTQGALQLPNQEIWLGVRSNGLGGPFNGDMKFGLMIDRALTEQERSDLATYADAL